MNESQLYKELGILTKDKSKRMRKAIIFDLDGTLWDATGCSVDIWNIILRISRCQAALAWTREKV